MLRLLFIFFQIKFWKEKSRWLPCICILTGKIQQIHLKLYFDMKIPFEIMFWYENTFEIMFWCESSFEIRFWRENSIEIIIWLEISFEIMFWHGNSFEIDLISCFHKKRLKKQSGQCLPTTFYIFSNQILEICILTGKIQ